MTRVLVIGSSHVGAYRHAAEGFLAANPGATVATVHHRSGPVGDGLDGALGHTVLMVGANTAVRHILALSCEVVEEFFCTKGMVVGPKAAQLDLEVVGEAFERTFTKNGLANTKRHLVDKVDEGRVTVDINGAAMALFGGSFLTTSVGEPTRGAADVLVTADLVAGLFSFSADGLVAIRPTG